MAAMTASHAGVTLSLLKFTAKADSPLTVWTTIVCRSVARGASRNSEKVLDF
jgi:hypothetical protein